MKVLVIGNADSIWIKSLVEKTHLAYGDDVSILSSCNATYFDYYKNNDVKVYKLNRIKSIRLPINILKNIGILKDNYNLISVQYVEKGKALWGIISSFFSKKVLLSFWGSDLLRQRKSSLLVRCAIRCSSAITLTTDEMYDRFSALYGYRYIKKIRRTKFGSNGISFISRIANKDLLYRKYGIDKNKVLVSIGYNGFKEQQHLKVLNEIYKLSLEDRKRIHLIIRVTYGNKDKEYMNQIKRAVEQTKCTNHIFEEYLSDDEVAEITAITDVFIHAQTTDARSASMCEHLYANCVVINPSWIKYPDFENNLFYLKFEDFDELRLIISNNLLKKEESIYRKELIKNTKLVYELCAWESFAPLWRDVYES